MVHNTQASDFEIGVGEPLNPGIFQKEYFPAALIAIQNLSTHGRPVTSLPVQREHLANGYLVKNDLKVCRL